MQTFFNLIRRISARTTQFMLGVLATFWGFWVILPLQPFESAIGFFSPLALSIPEFWWGVSLLILGILTMATIFDDLLARTRFSFMLSSRFAFILSTVHLLFWGFVLVSFAMFDYTSMSVPTYFTILLTAFLNYVKLYVENDLG